ncbi:MAG: peroxiredoxin [Epsilonproteobacteria bacterium]|nr:peroxiredoxin [Campylobacterota bacterium]NPA56804.1 peroxiredoxin [Campylobacterota bacterium]
MIEIGREAPPFCLPNQDGVEICLHDLRGKWVILYFYPRDNTPGCTREAQEFTERLRDLEELGAVVIGVSPQGCESHRRFAERHNLEVMLLCDEGREVIKEYGAWGKKRSYGKEYEGVLRSTVLIDPEGKVREVWRNVRVKGHVDRVYEKLKEKVKEERGV